MLDGPAVATALAACGVTHVIWLPDSELGTWQSSLETHFSQNLIRVCREGEAFAVAGGLYLGGKTPIVIIQCTGLFEAGDALRNIVHDCKLPLFMIIGLRSHHAHQQGKSSDTCPQFSEPIMQTWKIPYVILDQDSSGNELTTAIQEAAEQKRAGAVLFAE